VSVELPSGQVLLAGGGVNSNMPKVSSTGELLPADGSNPFTAAGTMKQGRLYAAATLLQSGKVLIAGGDPSWSQASAVPATAEVWNPAGGGTFTATGTMHVPRQVLTLTTLPDGQALAVGGSPDVASGAGSPTAELYNPATNKWTLTGSMPSGRLGHTATLLPNCKVLIVGDAPNAVTYNYVTGAFAGSGAEGTGLFQRSYQTATVLPNGKVLIAGGETAGRQALNTASLYNPATGKFTPTANKMSTAHSQGFAARLPDGRVIVGGGFIGKGTHQTVTDNVDIYDPKTNTWASRTSLLPNSLAYSVESQTLHDGDVVVMGTGQGNQSEIFTPTSAGTPAPPGVLNCSDLFSIVSAATGARGVIALRIGVPFAGAIKGTATVPVQKGVPKALTYGTASKIAGRSGVFTLTISPGSRARSLLKSRGSLRVSVAVTFTQPHTSPLHRSKSVTAKWS
jgi:hypothetical protein